MCHVGKYVQGIFHLVYLLLIICNAFSLLLLVISPVGSSRQLSYQDVHSTDKIGHNTVGQNIEHAAWNATIYLKALNGLKSHMYGCFS